MAKMLQIRNVRDEVQRTLKARAAAEGVTLSDYLRRIVERAAERPSVAELRTRLRARWAVDPAPEPSEVIRRERDAQ